MSAAVDIDGLRVAAALAHSTPNGDVELVGRGRRWIVSYHSPCATVDPCGFRQLVLATMRGCRVALLPADELHFVRGIGDIGGGVYESLGGDRRERFIATFLPVDRAVALLADVVGGGAAVTARVTGDPELGVSVVTVGAVHPSSGFALDTTAQRIAATLMVDELLADVGVTPSS